MSIKLERILNSDINILDLSNDINIKFQDNDIRCVKDLWVLGRRELKNMGLSDKDINSISIKMQLSGLDLNKKVYGKL